MITQPLFDFSNVVLSRNRRPYFRASRQCWYFKDANGKQYRLHSDEQRAFEIWRSIVGPEPEPVVVPGIVREPQPARPKVSIPKPPKPVPAPKPKPARPKRERTYERPQCRMQRTLVLVKLMADKRLPHLISDIHSELEDLAGVQVCERTVKRDLELLERAGVVQRVDRNRWKSRIEFWSYRVSKVLL